MDHNPHRKSGTLMLIIAWAIIFAVLFWLFEFWNEKQFNPNPQPSINTQLNEVMLQRNRDGHYVASGEINGVPVTFLLDTGATSVAISTELANQLNLKRGEAVNVQTANGRTLGYQTRLDNVRLGIIEVNDVSALITDGIEADMVLLGMSFLRQLEFTQKNGMLILKNPTGGDT